jgi:hypothetical protein
MKVLLVHDFLDKTGGAERIVYATKLLLEKSGHSVRLYAPAIQGSLANRLFSLRHYFTIRREIRRFKLISCIPTASFEMFHHLCCWRPDR